MDADKRQSLIEKIEALPPDARERVKGYVDALLKVRRADSGQGDGQNRGGEERSNEEDRYLRQDWAGALSDLKAEYTSLELEEQIMKQWARSARD